MNGLLDTHTLIWALTEPGRLPKRVREAISEPVNVCFVSCGSLWEIATKVRLGKWREAEPVEASLTESIVDFGYTLLPIDAPVALRAGRLPGAHGDPFDRIIAAQALLLDVPLFSADKRLDAFGVRRVW